MNCISEKMKSRAGASILMAMVLFLICGFVAAVTLGAAATNAGKYTSQREQQQNYLAISSSARMLRELLGGKKFVGTEEKWIYFCKDQYKDVELKEGEAYEEDRFKVCKELKTEDDNNIQKLIADGLYQVYLSKERYVGRKPFSGWTERIVLRFSEVPELADYPVDAVVTVDRDYRITITLKTAAALLEEEEYAMVLTFKAEETESESIESFSCENDHHGTEEVKDADGKTVKKDVSFRCTENQHYSKTTTIQLSDGDIRKEVQAR